MATELRWALRHLARRPGFLLLGVLSLGLGLAASALVFMAVNTLAWEPVPGLAEPERLVEVGRLSRDGSFDSFSYPDFDSVRSETRSLEQVFAWRMAPAYATVGRTPQRALALLVSGEYFTALGAGAAHGRLLVPADEAVPGAGEVVVASHAAFQRLFGGDPAAVGSEIAINGSRYTLVGVAARGFRGHITALQPDFFVPLSMAAPMHAGGASERDSRQSRSLMLGGRLAPGATLEQANAELEALALRLAEAHPESNSEVRFAVAPLRPLPHAAQRLIGMLAGALFVLCIAIVVLACTNLAGVLLAQGEARAGEFAVRNVLGASRGRIARQLLLESCLVAAGAGALALVLVQWGKGLLNLLPLPATYPIDLALRFDARVAAFCVVATAVVALGFGLLPALRVSRAAPGRDAARVGGGLRGDRQRLRHGLLAFQATMTVALLLTAALVLRALQTADPAETGFRTEHVYTAEVDLTPLGMEPGPAAERLTRLTDALRQVPGVTQAGFASVVPLTLSRLGFGPARAEAAADPVRMDVNTVGEGFFDAFGLPVRGRALDRTDVAGGPRTAVINAALAERLFGTADPLGQSFEMGGPSSWQPVRVVGVVPDGRYASLSDVGTPFAFLPAAQWQRTEFSLVLQTDGTLGAEGLRRAIEQELGPLLPGVPPPAVHDFASAAMLSVLPQTILATAASALGVLALVLAAVGLHGVLAFQVQRRVREIGLRRALGAPSPRLLRGVLGRSLAWLGAGALLGVLLAQLLALALGDLLFGVRGHDPAALAIVVLACVAMLVSAAAIPVRRALTLQPGEALRHD